MECFVCFDPLDDDIYCGPCDHTFCMDCYFKLRKLECPMCRCKLKNDHEHPAFGRTLSSENNNSISTTSYIESTFANVYQPHVLEQEIMFEIPLEAIELNSSMYDPFNIMGWRLRRRRKRERNAEFDRRRRLAKSSKPLTRRQRRRQAW